MKKSGMKERGEQRGIKGREEGEGRGVGMIDRPVAVSSFGDHSLMFNGDAGRGTCWTLRQGIDRLRSGPSMCSVR